MLNRQIFLFTILIFSLLAISCSTFKSNVYIPPQEQFMLGEDSDYSFKAELDNRGDEVIEIVGKDKDGNTTQSFGLSPKGRATVNIPRNEYVVIKNKSDQEAHVKAKLNRGVAGMRYEPVK